MPAFIINGYGIFLMFPKNQIDNSTYYKDLLLVNNTMLQTFPETSHFECPECGKLISRNSLLRHRTTQGCTQMKWETKLKNWQSV